MISMHDLKPGDIVRAEFEGQRQDGVVLRLNHEDREVCIETPVQEFWYAPDHLYPIPLDEEQLMKLGFEKHENGDGSVKYLKGAFRLLLHRKGDFTDLEFWWREDHRHVHRAIYVHELQNHYLQMTKVELNPD